MKITVGAAIVALTFIGCKPTEGNYRDAYDAALSKRAEAVAEQMRPATGLLSDDGPQLRVIDGDSIYVLRERLRTLEGAPLKARWAVAVGSYKMDTNAKASVSDLAGAGYHAATVAKAHGGRYFALSDTASTLDGAREKARKFKLAFPKYPYVGLPASPVLISL